MSQADQSADVSGSEAVASQGGVAAGAGGVAIGRGVYGLMVVATGF